MACVVLTIQRPSLPCIVLHDEPVFLLLHVQAYLFAIQTPIVGLDHHIAITRNVETSRLHLFGLSSILVGGDDLFYLRWCNLFDGSARIYFALV